MPTVSRLLDPTPVTDLDDYIGRGGGRGLEAARLVEPAALIDTVQAAGLRGRGGAGFPTGIKWSTIVTNAGRARAVVVNAAEGEPGTFKDRMLLRHNPFLVLEGACIAALAVDADEIIVAAKSAFTREIERLQQARGEIIEAGWVADTPIHIVEGPGEYLYGEETALLEVIEGQPPFPRVIPPYRHGVNEDDPRDPLGAPPSLVDNVETLANVPGIIVNGADWFREYGTERSPGTILCTVTGDIDGHGVAEFPMGTTMREVLETVGGDLPDIGAVLIGVSNPPLGNDSLDTPLTYEDMRDAGSGLGSASFIVVDTSRTPRDVAAGIARFLAVESCGQCQPCKQDGTEIAERLVSPPDRGSADDIVAERLTTVARGARCALAGQIERVVGALFALAEPRQPGVAASPMLIAPLIDIVDGRAVIDEAHAAKRADWSFEGDERDSHEDPVQRYADAPVTIRPAHTPEPDRRRVERPVTTSSNDSDPFAALHRSHAQIAATVDGVRAAPPGNREAALADLRREIHAHRDAVERYLYPLVERAEPDLGPEITWYPKHHEHHAERILDRIDRADPETETRLVDDLCADLHATLIEIDLRVIPLLEAHVGDDPRFERDLDADMGVEMDDT